MFFTCLATGMSSDPKEFASVDEIAAEIRRRLAARQNNGGSAGPAAASEGIASPGRVVSAADLEAPDDRTFVENVYRHLLGREPQEQEIESALGHIAAASRGEFLAATQSSAEARQSGAVVSGLPRPSGQHDHVSPQALLSVPAADRYRRKYSIEDLLAFDGAAFVTHVFRCLLKRDPDPAALSAALRAIDSGESSRLDFVADTAASPEVARAGVTVSGLTAPRRQRDPGPQPTPIDPARLQYTIAELANVPSEILIANLYRCLLKRNPDFKGAGQFSRTWESGVATAADLIYAIANSPEARTKGVRVSGLGLTRVRHILSAVPVIGPVVQIAACAVFLPQLGAQCRWISQQLRLVTTGLERRARQIDSLRAELAALTAWVGRLSAVPRGGISESTLRTLLDTKVDRERLSDALEQKADAAALNGLKEEVAAIRDRLDQQGDRQELAATLETVAALRARLDELQGDALAMDARKADRLEVGAALREKVDMAALEAGLAEMQAEKASRGELSELRARIDEKQREAQLAAHTLRLRTLDIERRLGLLLEEARKRLPEPLTAHQVQTLAGHLRGTDAAAYAEFEDIHRGSREDIKGRQSAYLPYLSKAPGPAVLDLGCGRGEFLEVLLENNYAATGVDLNPVMVRRCQDLGLPAQQGDAIEFLRSQQAKTYDAVSAFHVIEHLPSEQRLALLDEALRVLRPGGLLILETPNPRNLVVGACNFYMDPTHLNPIPPQLLQFLVEDRGFVNVTVLPLHPVPDYQRPAHDPLPEFLTDLLFGPQDYGIIASKA
jgi:SAM-dependent methyltransferase